MIIKNSIAQLIRRESLDAKTCQQILERILTQQSEPLQIAALLALLRAKGETVEELVSFASGLRQKMLPVYTQHRVLDIVGTGGDGAHTINISTGSAILAASCGIKIAKHGNAAVSSQTGSADVLTALGVNTKMNAEKIAACIDTVGIGFCFAPNFHPALHAVRPIRQALKIPTIFNLIAPLLNPTLPAHLLLGVYDKKLLPLMAAALQQLGTQRSLIVHTENLDEISCIGTAHMIEVTPQELKPMSIDPQKLGLTPGTVTDLKGGDPQENAVLLTLLLRGQTTDYPVMADTLALNAAMALYLYGYYDNIATALGHAQANLRSGKAVSVLKQWIEFSHD